MSTKVYDTVIEEITPEIAASYLATSPGNRAIKNTVVERYAAMMKIGHWELTPEPISFDDHGQLRNGHHRLTAVIKSGKAVKFRVVRGIKSEVFKYVDTGTPRSVQDASRFSGDPELADITKQDVAHIKVMIDIYVQNPTKYRGRQDFIEEFYIEYKPALEFCRNLLPRDRKYLGNASISAAFGVASMHENKEILREFARLYRVGPSENPTNKTPLVYRDWILSEHGPKGNLNSGSGARNDMMVRTELVLKRYCGGGTYKRMPSVTDVSGNRIAPPYELPGISNLIQLYK